MGVVSVRPRRTIFLVYAHAGYAVTDLLTTTKVNTGLMLI